MGQRPNHISATTTTKPQKSVSSHTPQATPMQNTLDLSGYTPETMLYLQRTIGNQAVQHLITPKKPNAIQRKLDDITLDEFKRMTGQAATNRGIKGFFKPKKSKRHLEEREKVMTGETAKSVLDTQRGELKQNKALHGTARMDLRESITQTTGDSGNINKAFAEFLELPSYIRVMNLYHQLTYWKALNVGQPWFKTSQKGIEQLLELTRQEMDNRISKTMTIKTGDSQTAEGVDATGMPEKFKKVGIPFGFYKDHIQGKPKLEGALSDYYDSVKGGDIDTANTIYDTNLKDITGMAFIKSVIYSYYTKQANLKGIVGTDRNAKRGQALTPDELSAVVLYTDQSFVGDFNNTMRNFDPTKFDRQNLSSEQARVMNLVSALNKLPIYAGNAFRVFTVSTAGMRAAWQPGGIAADLGFTSASPSMTGVRNYDADGSGVIYFFVHAKSASNVMGLSGVPREGEIVFRPGTRFFINAVWKYVNGRIPAEAPAEAKMVLYEEREEKTKTDQKSNTKTTNKVQVVEVTEL